VQILGDYVDDMAVVGGWVPALLAPDATERHIGSTDVDLAFNLENINDDAYATIHKLLQSNGYLQNDKKNALFKYFKTVTVSGQEIVVEVDLLVGEYEGERGMNRRHEALQDAKALRARGADLLFPDHTEAVKISGHLPNKGGLNTVHCKVAGVVAFIVMKGIVLVRRKKQKDAYDIEYVLRQYPGSIDAVAAMMEPDLNHGLVKESLQNIADKFETPEHMGPIAVADFLMSNDQEERERIQQRAFQTIDEFLEKTLRK
jgi:hypothetical protein